MAEFNIIECWAQASGVERHERHVIIIFSRGSAPLYVSIGEMKERDGWKWSETGGAWKREEREGCFTSLPSYKGGLVAALIGSPRIHLGFSSRLEIDFLRRSSLPRRLGAWDSSVETGGERRDVPRHQHSEKKKENRSEKAQIGMIKVLPRIQTLCTGVWRV